MDIPRAASNPIHCRKMSDRVAAMTVKDEFRLRGSTRSEIQKQRVVGFRQTVRDKTRIPAVKRIERTPALLSGTAGIDGDACVAAREVAELGRAQRIRHNMFHGTTRKTVRKIAGVELRRGRNDDGTNLHRGKHRLPELDAIAKHHEDAVPSLDSQSG